MGGGYIVGCRDDDANTANSNNRGAFFEHLRATFHTQNRWCTCTACFCTGAQVRVGSTHTSTIQWTHKTAAFHYGGSHYRSTRINHHKYCHNGGWACYVAGSTFSLSINLLFI